MKKTFRFGDVAPWRYFLVVSLILGALFAMMSPEGTTDRGAALAILQWLAQSVIPMGCCIAVHLALHRLAFFDRMNPWLKLLISGAGGAALFSPSAYAIDLFLGDKLAPGEHHASEWLKELLSVLLPVTFIWVAINIPFNLGFSLRRKQQPVKMGAEKDQSVAPMPGFLSLVEPQYRGEVLHMKSELHYLSVTTMQGRSLVLYTLRDAISELAPDSGIQTHRSYWANLSHVAKLEKSGRSGRLIMDDGEIIPVSRTNIKTVQVLLDQRSPDSAVFSRNEA